MTLLTLINSATAKIGLPSYTSVIGNTDQQVRELLDCAQEEGFELGRMGPWQELRKQTTFTTVAQYEQTGALPSDFDRFSNDTMFNRSLRKRVFGPISADEWQARIALAVVSVVEFYFIIRNNQLLMTGPPTAGETVAYEYFTPNFCKSALDVEQSEWLADSDTGRLSERIMAIGVAWRFLQKKGMGTYQAYYDKWTHEVDEALGRSGGSPRLTIGARWNRVISANIPDGNWPG